MTHFYASDVTSSTVNSRRRPQHQRRRMLIALGALCVLVPGLAIDAQPIARGIQVGLAATASRPVLSGDARNYWSPLGNFGPAVGGQAKIGYDWSSYGAAVSFEAATASVGARSGATYGVAVLGYWIPNVRIGDSWQPRATLGYVREGMLINGVVPGETNNSATRIQTVASGTRNVGMTGNGARVGLDIERPMNGVTLITGVNVDIVGFDTVTDDSEDISLNRTGWSVIPRLTVGIRFHP